eukprot:scaffold109688_cov31-Tisochrysis_lutea.AAC.2
MAALYLSHRARRRAARPTDDHSEVELMLEAASTQYADLDDRILGVKSTVQARHLSLTLNRTPLSLCTHPISTRTPHKR